jgi:hypothetical protein
MDRLLEKLWRYVAHGRSLTMRERLFILTCLVVVFVCFCVLLPSNFLEPDMPMAINVADVALGLFALLCFLEARRGRNHIGIFLTVMILVLNFVWFLDGGMEGSVNFNYFGLVVLPMVFFEGRLRWLFVFGMLIDVCGLNLLGYKFPSLITPFPHRAEQVIDLIAGLVSSFVAIVMVLWVVLAKHPAGPALADRVDRHARAVARGSPRGFAANPGRHRSGLRPHPAVAAVQPPPGDADPGGGFERSRHESHQAAEAHHP